ncbi:hypothetical protein [Pleomorphochaeta sp. DL1XJH-081]|uniref:hypothetical protein n=1 Tax=Pleomorphochaeta sp. DL1XJH-081 TaxID=3409690 RepID=UPI003BB610E6
MADVLVNNFTSGEVSPKLGGRPDLGIYHSGVSKLENFLIMIQGGVTRRPGTVLLETLEGECRIIPFTISVHLSFLVELSNQKLSIRYSDGSLYPLMYEGNPVEGFPVPYLADELPEVQFTQDYQTLYLAHRNHPPKMLTYIGGSFMWSTLEPTTDSKYAGMFQSAGNYPGCVAYCSNRLWFASSENHPYRLWASRPFVTHDFRTFDIVTSVDKVIKDAPWPEGWEEDQSLIYEDQTIIREVTSADNAMVLEVGSNRNDRIEWLTVGQNLLVGTSSGEWIMPGNIDALNQSIMQVSAYGSASLQAMNVNEDVLFIQSGKKRCRGYVMSNGGYSSPDISYTADHILSSGVREWAFQRVPEPRAYMVLNDGTMAVLSYNKLYQIQGWSQWTFSGLVESVAVLDTPTGQSVCIVINRNGTRAIERFDEDSNVHSDQHNTDTPDPFDSILVSNRFETQLESGSSIGKSKKVSKVVLRLLESGAFMAGYNGLETYSKHIQEGDVAIRLGGGYDKELKMEVRSIGDEPLTILAMVYALEVA